MSASSIVVLLSGSSSSIFCNKSLACPALCLDPCCSAGKQPSGNSRLKDIPLKLGRVLKILESLVRCSAKKSKFDTTPILTIYSAFWTWKENSIQVVQYNISKIQNSIFHISRNNRSRRISKNRIFSQISLRIWILRLILG